MLALLIEIYEKNLQKIFFKCNNKEKVPEYAIYRQAELIDTNE